MLRSGSLRLPFRGQRSRLSLTLLGLLLALIGIVTEPYPGLCQTARGLRWAIDPQGAVECSVRYGDALFVGGHFGGVCPLTGGGVMVDPVAGALTPGSPCVAGTVNASVSDGAGGWFIGGSFTAVSGIPRHNLAHVLADGRVAGWAPQADGEVFALALDRSVVYAGGAFASVSGATRARLAAIDAVTGEPLPLNAAFDGEVRAVCVNQGTLILGGSFSQIGDVSRPSVAALELSTGALLGWSPSTDGTVLAIAAWGDTVVLAGNFHHVAGVQRDLIASVLAQNGQLTDFDASVMQEPPVTGFSPEVRTLALEGRRLYLGGIFDHLGTVERQGLGAVDRATGNLLDWDPQLRGGEVPGYCGAIALSGTALFVAGSFASLGGEADGGLAGAVDTRSGDRLPWRFQPNQVVQTLAVSGAKVFAGGIFSGVGDRVPRAGLAAFSLSTGDLLPWNPSADGDVFAMAARDGLVYLSGNFLNVDAEPHQSLAAVDAATGAPAAWSASCDGPVLSIQLADSLLYLGGRFTQVSGVSRSNLAAVSLSTGAPTSWNPGTNDLVESIAVDGPLVYAAGFFTVIGGQRRNYVAAVDRNLGLASTWRTQAIIGGDLIAVHDTTVYVAGALVDVLGDLPVSALLAVSSRTGRTVFSDTLDLGSPNASSRVLAMAEHEGVVYLGGDFSVVSSMNRPRLAAVDGASGQVLDWDAQLTGPVFALLADSLGVVAGGRVSSAAGVPCGQFAVLSPANGSPPPPPSSPSRIALRVATPSDGLLTLEFSLSSAGPATLTVFDLQGRRMLQPLADAFLPEGGHVMVIDATRFRSGVYFCQLQAGGASAVGKVVIAR